MDIAAEELRSLLSQVEAELHRSVTYGQVLSRVQNLPDEVGSQVQQMMRAISREAIRIAFRQLVRPKSIDSAAPLPTTRIAQLAAPSLPQPTSESAVLADAAVLSPSSDMAVAAAPSIAANPLKQTKSASRKRLTRKELAAQAAQQAWEERLRELGQEIRQIRQSKSLSPYHLHLRTQIPLHQLEALEAGAIDRLPEDVYIRSFIRQVGKAMGVDGVALAASLPVPDPVKAILPSWYRPIEQPGRLRAVHLYLGYAAVMAGGITWLSHQSVLNGSAVPPTPSTPTNDALPQQGSTTPSRQSSQNRAPVAIALPETQPL
jgi:hypothetical protein